MKKQTARVKNTCSSKPAVTDSFVVIFQKVQCINHSFQLTADREDYEFFADIFPHERRPLKLKRGVAKVIARITNHGEQNRTRLRGENSVCSSWAATAWTLCQGLKKSPDEKSSPGFPHHNKHLTKMNIPMSWPNTTRANCSVVEQVSLLVPTENKISA